MRKWFRLLFSAVFMAGTVAPAHLRACAACFGQSNDDLAKGFNWGIFSLLAFIVTILGLISCFFVMIAKRSAAFAAQNPGGSPGPSVAQN